MIRLTGLDDAVIGVGYSHGMDEFLIYSEEKILEILMQDDEEMTLEMAIEHMEFNIKGGYFGEGNPTFLRGLEGYEREELLPPEPKQLDLFTS
jgi:hypothetical protein